MNILTLHYTDRHKIEIFSEARTNSKYVKNACKRFLRKKSKEIRAIGLEFRDRRTVKDIIELKWLNEKEPIGMEIRLDINSNFFTPENLKSLFANLRGFVEPQTYICTLSNFGMGYSYDGATVGVKFRGFNVDNSSNINEFLPDSFSVSFSAPHVAARSMQFNPIS